MTLLETSSRHQYSGAWIVRRQIHCQKLKNKPNGLLQRRKGKNPSAPTIFYQEIYVNGACSQKDYSALHTEQVEAKTSLQEYVSVAEVNNIPKFYDRDNACGDKCDILPSFEKFFRAARVLGVCLPSKELYSNVQRRLSGVCEGHSSDNCLQTQSNLLRVLNKRF